MLDEHSISNLTTIFKGIIFGFCIPCLNEADCKKLLLDCANLLENKGILYISFVEGLPEQSGFIVGSSGDRAYFCYHSLERLKTSLQSYQITLQDIWHIHYPINETDSEVHTVMLLRKE